MQEYIPPFLYDLYVRAYDDTSLRFFIIAIIAVGGIFFLKTATAYLGLKGSVETLRKSLESQLGDPSLPPEHFANQEVSPEWRNGDIRNAFKRAGLEGQWKRFEANLTFYVNRQVPVADEGVILNLLSGSALEKSKIPAGTFGRGAFLTALGVLGTFIGLVMGVSAAGKGLASNDSQIAMQSLTKLLEGAELAFITSILGLILSLLHGMLLNACRRRLHRSAQLLCDYLNLAFNAAAGNVRVARTMNSVRSAIEEARIAGTKERAFIAEGVEVLAKGLASNMQHLQELSNTSRQQLSENREFRDDVGSRIVGHLQGVVTSLGSIHGHTAYVGESLFELRGRAEKSRERKPDGVN